MPIFHTCGKVICQVQSLGHVDRQRVNGWTQLTDGSGWHAISRDGEGGGNCFAFLQYSNDGKSGKAPHSTEEGVWLSAGSSVDAKRTRYEYLIWVKLVRRCMGRWRMAIKDLGENGLCHTDGCRDLELTETGLMPNRFITPSSGGVATRSYEKNSPGPVALNGVSA